MTGTKLVDNLCTQQSPSTNFEDLGEAKGEGRTCCSPISRRGDGQFLVDVCGTSALRESGTRNAFEPGATIASGRMGTESGYVCCQTTLPSFADAGDQTGSVLSRKSSPSWPTTKIPARILSGKVTDVREGYKDDANG